MSQPTRVLGVFATVILALVSVPLAAVGTASAAAPPDAPGCATAVLAHASRAADVRRSDSVAFGRAAARNRTSATALARLAEDRTLWLDRCGQAYYVEPQTATTASSTPSPATATVPLADTFTLESRPGSARTIYLDFTGGTVTGTAWNNSYGASITVDPFSITAPSDTAFTDQELTEIQKAWQVVAEDYAPFDVNVTTKDPGAAAIDRSSSTDMVYGTRVRITAGGPIYSSCGCGGIAYINVFNTAGSNHGYYQPAFVFTNGTGLNGKYFGEAAAHESGHNFGLNHDGTSTASYYSGSSPWAPIMGSSYGQPVTQWSRGEYAGANNTQDDLAVIATGAPLRADDHGDTTGAATPLAAGQTADGLVSTRTDVDAFTFSAAGTTTVTVAPAPGLPDLDVSLRIADSSGATVATVDPAVSRTSFSVAAGLGASWSATLPTTPATYTAYVDGTGTGDPLTAGKYSDYGSLGNYQVSLATDAGSAPPTSSTPLSASASNPPAATVGTSWSATPASASGGTGTYSWSAAGLPAGLTVAASTGTVSGTPSQTGSFPVTFTVSDGAGATAAASATVTVESAPPSTAPLAFSTSSLPGGKTSATYSAVISVTGGTPAYTWSTSGTLPPGLALDAGTGASVTLSGRPTAKGRYSFTVRVVDGTGVSVSRGFTVNINR